ncbi:uncharacterized protein LOC135112169 isoform X1 [Scylla paramamosain]|uniref:uncharacterized protein LOC135112169 isoform X1 n=1 Tax=Scylla paramamosain TaxID=85552 RepID=UPI003082748A
MADRSEFPDAVESEAREVVAGLIREQDWEEEEKEKIHKEYIAGPSLLHPLLLHLPAQKILRNFKHKQEFGAVLQEMLPMVTSLYLGRKPTVTRSVDDDDNREALEEAKVRHEATVIAITKKRKEYPQYLSKLLGKTTRLKKEAVAVMKVDMQLPEPMEEVGTATDLDNTYWDALKEEVNDNLIESTHNILMDVERLSGLVDFARVSRQLDPLSIFDDFTSYRATKSS